MSWVDRVADGVARSGVARRMPARGPLILMYHGLGGADGVSPDAFAAQLDLLAASRRVLPLADALTLLGRPEASQVAAVTFDDGYRDFAEHAVPALAERGLHATLFVPAAHVGGSNVWDAGIAPARPLLDAAGLRGLDARYVTVGAHGLSHVRLRGLSAERLAEETATARQRLEELLGAAVSLFAYPYGQRGDFDAAAERAVEAAGFSAACSTCFGRGSRTAERFRLRRVGVGPGDTLARVRAKLDGAYDWVAWKEALANRLRNGRAAA